MKFCHKSLPPPHVCSRSILFLCFSLILCTAPWFASRKGFQTLIFFPPLPSSHWSMSNLQVSVWTPITNIDYKTGITTPESCPEACFFPLSSSHGPCCVCDECIVYVFADQTETVFKRKHRKYNIFVLFYRSKMPTHTHNFLTLHQFLLHWKQTHFVFFKCL